MKTRHTFLFLLCLFFNASFLFGADEKQQESFNSSLLQDSKNELVMKSASTGISLDENDYVMNFEDNDSTLLKSWSYYDKNNDNNTWGLSDFRGIDYSGSLAYYYDDNNAADDWMYTPQFALKTGENYEISFYYAVGSIGETIYPEKFKLAFGTERLSGMTNTIYDYGTVNDTNYVKTTKAFTVDSDDDYYIGFYCYSDANQYYLTIDSLVINKIDSSSPEETTWTNYTTINTGSNGIVSNDIRAYLEDSNGNQWYGTYKGLTKYDGSTYTTYTVDDGLGRNIISCLYEDQAGNIWIGTEYGGVHKYDGTTITKYNANNGVPSNTIYAILEWNNSIVIGTGDGIATFDGSSFNEIPGFPENTGWDIALDANNNLWAAGYNGVIKYDGTNFTTYTTDDGLLSNSNWALCFDNSGNLWIGSGYSGLNTFDGTTFTSYKTYNSSIVNDGFKAIDLDANGTLWFATYGGLMKYDGSTFTNFTTDDGLSHRTVNSLFINGQNIYCPTEFGLNIYNGSSFSLIETADGLIDNDIQTIGQDASGKMYFGTYDQGYSTLGANQWDSEIPGDVIPDEDIKDFLLASNGIFWIATDNGLVKIDGDNTTLYKTSDGLADNNVSALAEDANGNIWIASNGGGVDKYDGSSFTNYSTDDGMISNYNISIAISGSDVYVGSSSYGVSHFDGTTWTRITEADGLADNGTWDMLADSQGNIWFGTNYNGVTKFDGTTYTIYDANNGLSQNDNINGIIEDNDQNIWLVTEGGAALYQDDSWTYYNEDSGFVNDYLTAGFCDKDGNLWFGMNASGVMKLTRSSNNNGGGTIPSLKANFEATTATSGTAPLDVSFAYTSEVGSASPTSWFWDFGDGATESSSMMGFAMHQYTSPGTYDVKLVVTNADGKDSMIMEDYVTVNPSENGIKSTRTGGLWNETSTWIGGVIPSKTDNVIIDGPVTAVYAEMQSLSVTENGELMNKSSQWSVRLDVYGNLLNNGTIKDNPNANNSLRIRLDGDFHNNGSITNSEIILNSMATQTITANQEIGLKEISKDSESSSSVFIGAEVTFNSTHMDCGLDSLIISEGCQLNLVDTKDEGYNHLEGAIITGGGVLYMQDGCYVKSSSIENITLKGLAQVKGDVHFKSNVTNSDTLQQASHNYSVQLFLDEDFTNDGVIRNNPDNNNQLTIIATKNITNKGVWKNSSIKMLSSSPQTIAGSQAFEISEIFKDSEIHSDIIIDSDVTFKGAHWLRMSGDSVIITSGNTLCLDNSIIRDSKVKGGGTLMMKNDAQTVEVDFEDISLTGLTQAKGEVHFYSQVSIIDTLQQANHDYPVSFYFEEDITIDAVVRNNPHDNDWLNIETKGNIVANNNWKIHTITFNGESAQNITIAEGKYISLSSLDIEANKTSSSYQWIKDGKELEDKTSSKLIDGYNLNFNSNSDHTYYCQLEQETSRKVTINKGYTAPILTADFTMSGGLNVAPYKVQFTDASTGNPTSWEWDFNNDGSIDSELQNPEYTFTEEGFFSVKLTVSDGTNTVSTLKENIVFVMPPALKAAFGVDKTSGEAPLSVQFSDSSTNATSWKWDFDNDGTIDSEEQNPSYTFTEADTYSVKLTVGNGTSSDEVLKTDYITVSKASNEALDTGIVILNSRTTNDLLAVDFPSLKVGYAVGQNGTILKTTNSGDTWSDISSSFDNDMTDVFFINENTGFVVGKWKSGAKAPLLKTTNGGATWEDRSVKASHSTDIFFLNESVGYYACETDIMKTTDKGENWTPLTDPTDNYSTKPRCILFTDEATGYLGTGMSPVDALYATKDGGSNWSRKTYDGDDIYALDTADGFVYACSSSKIYIKQENGWSFGKSTSKYGIRAFDMISSEVGYAAGTNGLFINTTDGAENWTSIDLETTADLADVFFANDTVGYIVGEQGIIVRYVKNNVSEINALASDKVYDVTLYPNPAQNTFTVKAEIGLSSIEVYDLNGTKLVTKLALGANKTSIDISHLYRGLYLVKIEGNNGVYTKQLSIK